MKGGKCSRCGKKLVRDKKRFPENGIKQKVYCQMCFNIMQNGWWFPPRS